MNEGREEHSWPSTREIFEGNAEFVQVFRCSHNREWRTTPDSCPACFSAQDKKSTTESGFARKSDVEAYQKRTAH